jgi:hypothetical protein
MGKTDTIESQDKVVSGFGQADFVGIAADYVGHRQLVNAASRYDSLDDAIAGLTDAWNSLERMAASGAEYTPARELGFGQANGAEIAATLLGRRKSVSEFRKAVIALVK